MELGYLANLSETDFEAERQRLIREAIDAAPAEHRKRMLATQYQLDVRRAKLPQDQYVATLFHDIGENLENMLDQFNSIQNLAVQR